MTKKFMFQFINGDVEPNVVKNYCFDFINLSDEEIQTRYDKSMEGFRYETVLDDMEEYGTHDYFGNETVLHGFTSAEVNPARYNTVTKHWKRYFSDVVGIESGPIYITEGNLEGL